MLWKDDNWVKTYIEYEVEGSNFQTKKTKEDPEGGCGKGLSGWMFLLVLAHQV